MFETVVGKLRRSLGLLGSLRLLLLKLFGLLLGLLGLIIRFSLGLLESYLGICGALELFMRVIRVLRVIRKPGVGTRWWCYEYTREQRGIAVRKCGWLVYTWLPALKYKTV